MLADFLKYIEENRLLKKDDRILAAVSGGIDSMVMTDLLLKSGFKIGIAHCNFQLRKKDSERDEEMVRNFALNKMIPFYTIRFKTKEHAKEKGISIEMAARELRYDWFEKTRMDEGYDVVAVAHNLNDNIETFLLNLTRGTGITGLSGMRISGNNIVRPLLFATRHSIIEYSIKNEISFREDKTNADTKITRNKIRHVLIPLLKEFNPSIEATLNDTAERLNGINKVVSDYILRIRNDQFVERDNCITVKVNSLNPHINNQTVMFELFRPFGITGSLLRDLLKVIGGRTGGQIITGTHRLIKNRHEILISETTLNIEQSLCIAKPGDLMDSGFITSVRIIKTGKDFKLTDNPSIAYLDSQKVTFPVLIRRWQPGDYFYPLGMNRRKKLSDYFIDRKYSRFEKEKAMILESRGEIVWIIGDRIDNRFRITKATHKALVMRCNPLV